MKRTYTNRPGGPAWMSFDLFLFNPFRPLPYSLCAADKDNCSQSILMLFAGNRS